MADSRWDPNFSPNFDGTHLERPNFDGTHTPRLGRARLEVLARGLNPKSQDLFPSCSPHSRRRALGPRFARPEQVLRKFFTPPRISQTRARKQFAPPRPTRTGKSARAKYLSVNLVPCSLTPSQPRPKRFVDFCADCAPCSVSACKGETVASVHGCTSSIHIITYNQYCYP